MQSHGTEYKLRFRQVFVLACAPSIRIVSFSPLPLKQSSIIENYYFHTFTVAYKNILIQTEW